MHYSNTALFCLTTLTSYAAAQANGLAFTTVPSDCQVGQSCTIEWEGAGGAVGTSLISVDGRPRARVPDAIVGRLEN